jgi:acetyltransferase-like isoleucine patch superfamily enzyme
MNYNPIQVLDRTGFRGTLKSVYYSHRCTNSLDSLIFHSNVITEISSKASFDIGGKLLVGIRGGASHRDRANSHFYVSKDASIKHSGETTARVGPGSILQIYGDLSIGDSYLNSDCRVICKENINIGDDVAIAWDVDIIDADSHKLVDENNTDKKNQEIEIRDNVWIGHGVSVLKGVTIGEGSVIASRSLVNSDVPSNSLAAGIPTEVIEEDVEWE